MQFYSRVNPSQWSRLRPDSGLTFFHSGDAEAHHDTLVVVLALFAYGALLAFSFAFRYIPHHELDAERHHRRLVKCNLTYICYDMQKNADFVTRLRLGPKSAGRASPCLTVR